MIEGTLKNGFQVRISDEAQDDYEIFEALAEIDEEGASVGKLVPVYKKLLGMEQYNELKEKMRDESGHISTGIMLSTLEEIFELNDGEVKNSQTSPE